MPILRFYACKEKRNGIRRFQPAMRDAANERAHARTRVFCAQGRTHLSILSAQSVPQNRDADRDGGPAALATPFAGSAKSRTIAAAFETAELAVKITDRMLDCVIADIKQWLDQGLGFGRIAVSASAADFLREDFAARVLEKLEGAGVSPQHLELEVTENVLVGRAADRVGTILQKLKRAGMTIALDDFGTGYASLSHLNAFPVDVLKIDQSFVGNLSAEERTNEHAIVRAIIGLAHNMKIQTVAEGVETRDQTERLQQLGCDAAQGYLFSRPVAPAHVPSALTHGLLHWPAPVRDKHAEMSSGIATYFRRFEGKGAASGGSDPLNERWSRN